MTDDLAARLERSYLAGEPAKPDDCWDGRYAICPWCGHQHGDCWEWVKEEPHATRCSGCDNMFTVEAHYNVQYRAYVTGKERP